MIEQTTHETALGAALSHLIVPQAPQAQDADLTPPAKQDVTEQVPATATEADKADAIFLKYRSDIERTQYAVKVYQQGGLTAVAYATALNYQMFMIDKASQALRQYAVTGTRDKIKDTDGAIAKVWRGCQRLSGYFQKEGQPPSVAIQVSVKDAAEAILDWLAERDVRSLDALGLFLAGKSPATKREKPLHERMVRAIETGTNDGKLSMEGVRYLADRILTALGPKYGPEFFARVTAKHAEIEKAAIEAAAKAAEAALKTGTEG